MGKCSGYHLVSKISVSSKRVCTVNHRYTELQMHFSVVYSLFDSLDVCTCEMGLSAVLEQF